MDKSKIGNARQQDDNRIAVANAKSLANCWQELGATFEEAELQSADYRPEQMATYRAMREAAGADSPEAQAWIKTCIMQDKATDTLREAFHYGKLPLWRIHDAREVPVAPVVLERDNVKHGVFKSHERPEPDMQGARLWVKRPDWEAFLALTVIPDPKQLRLPPNEPFVTLSEALTWIAFGVSMNRDLLHAVLSLDRYGERVPQEAIRGAVPELTALATVGKVAMRGKYWENPLDERRSLLTARIDPIKFADFRQFDYSDDELRHGEGLGWWRSENGVTERLASDGRSEPFIDVSVSRADLLREFPLQSDSEGQPAVIVMPLPDRWGSADCVELPPWLNMYQLVAWVQYRAISIVAKAGDWNGLEAQHLHGKEPQIGSVVDLERALQDGRLITYGLKKAETFAAIPPVEWTRIRLTPRDLAQQHPYLVIQVKREDALALFGSNNADDQATVAPTASVGAHLHGNDPPTTSEVHNDDERRQWMADQPMMDADTALASYRKHPLCDGTKQAEWRSEWREIRGTQRGRPRKLIR